jgi:outer membrane murein-binding lipoprotein Lpp
LQGLYNQQFPTLVPNLSQASNIFDIHYDMAPTFTFNGYGPGGTGDPNLLRQFERAAAQLTATSPITGKTDQLALYLVDRVGLNALHMITGDPYRTPNFVMFGNLDYYFEGANCSNRTSCLVLQEPGYAWNHGGVAKEINTTWVGFAGPGVERNGIDYRTWSDETDIRPTMLLLAGLQDDYEHDGRVLAEDLHHNALPPSVRGDEFRLLAAAYKQLNATVGSYGLDALKVSTAALASGNANEDSEYQFLESRLSALTTQRDAVAAQIKAALDAAEFQGERLDERHVYELLDRTQEVLWQADFLARAGR